MSAKVMDMPPVHRNYRAARYVLRNHSFHDLDAIDAAFDVLAYSLDPADKELCRIVADEMWQVPTPSASLIAITMLSVALTCIGLATLIGRLVL